MEDITEKQRRKHRMHPNSLKNLRPWQPGQSGNPNGREQGVKYISEIARERLRVIPPGCSKEWADLQADAWLERSLKHSEDFKELLNRIEGKVAETHRIQGDPEHPIQVVVNFIKDKKEDERA